MTIVLTVLHVLVCFALILIILLQAGKGAGMGAAFGGASQTLFGSTGRATFLTKITIVAASVFALTCLGLSISGSKKSKSVMEQYPGQEPSQPTAGESGPAAPVVIPPSSGGASGGEAPTGGLAPVTGPEGALAPPASGAPRGEVSLPVTIPPMDPGPSPETPATPAPTPESTP